MEVVPSAISFCICFIKLLGYIANDELFEECTPSMKSFEKETKIKDKNPGKDKDQQAKLFSIWFPL
jgi:hypothetical protein